MPRLFREKSRKNYPDAQALKVIFKIMGVGPRHIIQPLFLSLLVSFFSGISLALLIPISKGIAGKSFTFTAPIPIFNKISVVFLRLFEHSNQDNATFVLLVVLVFLATIFRNVFRYLRDVLTAYWNGKFAKNMNTYIFNRYLSFGKLFFDRTNQGYLQTVLNYSNQAQQLIATLQEAAMSYLLFAAYVTIMLLISWQLTLITLIICPILYYSVNRVIRSLKARAKLLTKAQIELDKSAFNLLSCIPLIQAYGQQQRVWQDYAARREKLRKTWVKVSLVRRLAGPIQEITMFAVLLLLVLFVTTVLIKGRIAELPTFVVFFYVAKKTLPLFQVSNRIKIYLAEAMPALKEVLKILDDQNKFIVPEGKISLSSFKQGIEIKRLNFAYLNNVPVLKDINLFIPKGQVTAIVGSTGSGKTTLVNLILRFYDCPAGTILLDGNDIRDFTLQSLRRQFSLVSQDAWLFNDTIKYNITFRADIDPAQPGLIDVAKKARLYDFIMSLPAGFNTYIGDRGIRLSGGEKQRVAIARALYKESEILILDEATSSLDSVTEKLIQQAIDEAVKGKTAIVIAHRLSTIKHADKIIVIEKGQLLEQGSLQQLLDQKGLFYRFWEEQRFY